MNFNTDSKFWKHLQVEGFATLNTPDASGYVAYDSSWNNGIMSIAEKKTPEAPYTYSWQPLVYSVQKGSPTDGGNVVQSHGVVTIQFPSTTPGSGSVKSFVGNIDVTNAANTVTSFGLILPDITYTAGTDYLTTTVYVVDEYNNIEKEVHPQLSIGTRTIDNQDKCYVTFDFKTHESLTENNYYKVCILYDGSATAASDGTWSLSASDLTPANASVARGSMTSKE